MNAYRGKAKKIRGTDFREVHQRALAFYIPIKKQTKRRPYIRSCYFKKGGVFLGLFWHHLYEKRNYRDQVRRMKYFPCALELIKNSHLEPISKENPNKPFEILHRFTGITMENDLFCVQIKENKRTGHKWLISVFPLN